ncbi:hypothetical protein RHSIM_Rhsim06G0095700 [Rhododendron simsii]|uniref:Non-reducing end beta-L-arabinofuranosidase-like GH127 catalytic domain-containing protein n=1 Tax=Rhododendron simsii TaxID=118357 RepID=A0A834GT20_RHOSS|nr:hypothetical protein RHSIM_Rhsim06G0095700 [Rhododendron simsii]
MFLFHLLHISFPLSADEIDSIEPVGINNCQIVSPKWVTLICWKLGIGKGVQVLRLVEVGSEEDSPVPEAAELASQEHNTNQLVRSQLSSLEIEYAWPFAGTGVVALIGSGFGEKPWLSQGSHGRPYSDEKGTGYLYAFPSELFDRFEAIKPVGHHITPFTSCKTCWAPYFTIHKGDSQHLFLAHLFDKPCPLGLPAIKADDVSDFHANTHIPIVIGSQMRYEVTGDSLYKVNN